MSVSSPSSTAWIRPCTWPMRKPARSCSPTAPSRTSTASMPWAAIRPCSPPPAARPRTPTCATPQDIGSDELPCEIYDGEIQHALSGHWYHLHERAIRWVDGRTVRVQVAADITDRKHIDEVNLQQQKRLEQTSRLITMGEMASSLAHELNQPLSAIANYCAGCVKRMQAGNYRWRTCCSPCRRPRRRPSGPARSFAACATWSRRATPSAAHRPGRTDRRGPRLRRHRGPAHRHAARRRPARAPAAHRGRPHHDRAGAAQPGQERHRGDERRAPGDVAS
jgi:hypothetical protein